MILFFFLALLALNASNASCPNNCNKNGECDIYSRCTCHDGYQGADCSEKICPFGLAWTDHASDIDKAHSLAECSNRGICDRATGDCKCMDGFTGSSCERLECANQCNNNGRCYSMRDLSIKTRNEYSESFLYSTIWDAEKIQGCYCDYPYFGYDCSQRQCSKGDDPLTTSQINEVQLVTCTANVGSFVLYYNGVPSAWIPHTANAAIVRRALLQIDELIDVKVTFSMPHGMACQLQTNIISIEFIQNFGIQSPLVGLGDTTLQASGGYIRVNADGATTWKDVGKHQLVSRKGSKEKDVCASRGLCDENTGICSCFDTNGDEYGSSNGYGRSGTRGDCGYVVSSTLTAVSTCPGTVQCSGHGLCDPETFRCYCSAGWEGGDCSEMSCPQGLSWFSYPSNDDEAHLDYAICSDMGHCDKTVGRCACRDGFYGEACEYMVCGGGLDNPCSGHGRCMTMAQLALWSEKNGDATWYTYGSDPNLPATWDYQRMHGCYCDPGYTGYDCSLRECIQGDDPGTYDDHVEVQLLQCLADMGNFTLSFRQQVTPILYPNITAVELQAVLSSLSTIQSCQVYFAYDGPPPNGTLTYVDPSLTEAQGTPPWMEQYNLHTGNFSYNTSHPRYNYNSTMQHHYPIGHSPFCRTDGTQVAIIEFTHTHSDLPAIQVNNQFLIDRINGNGLYTSGKVHVYTDGQYIHGLQSIRGTTENDVCNNRGLCDMTRGACQCFPTWTSSDGARQGGPGNTGDCGYRNDKINTFFESVRAP